MSYKITEIGEIPSDWEVVRIGDVADILSGFAFKSKDFIDTGVPVIKIKNIVPPYVTTDDVVYVSKELYEQSVRYQLNYNDILISMTGSNYNQLSSAVGKVGRVRMRNTHMLLNQRVGKIEIDEARCNKDFLYYNISTMETRYRLALSAGGSANQANISPKQIKSLTIPFPPLKEQESIASILASLDEKIETNEKINQKLEEMAAAIFKHWFVDFEFPNENGEPYRSSDGEMVESELGMIPNGWEIKPLSEFVDLSTKSVDPQKYPDKIFEHFSIPALDNNKTPEIQVGKEIKSSKYIINDKVVLISKLNPTTKRIWLPYPQGENPICSTEFMVYSPKRVDMLPYIYELINSATFSDMLVSRATGSTGSRQRVKPSNTLNFQFVLPSNDLIIDFSKLIISLHENISTRMIENQKLSLARDTLLPKLMSGEIRVPVEE